MSSKSAKPQYGILLVCCVSLVCACRHDVPVKPVLPASIEYVVSGVENKGYGVADSSLVTSGPDSMWVYSYTQGYKSCPISNWVITIMPVSEGRIAVTDLLYQDASIPGSPQFNSWSHITDTVYPNQDGTYSIYYSNVYPNLGPYITLDFSLAEGTVHLVYSWQDNVRNVNYGGTITLDGEPI